MEFKFLKEIKNIKGRVSFYYKNLFSGEEYEYNSELPLFSASLIKIPVLVEAFSAAHKGITDLNENFTIKESDKVPSCGALTYMHNGLTVTFEDLCTLMIILSDNTATNLLIKKLGFDNINNTIKALGLKQTALNRLMYDFEKAKMGINNIISAKDTAILLEKLYKKELVSVSASEKMLKILKNQRLNGKIPFFIKDKVEIAHKTGEDNGITHDAGIVFCSKPFIICFCSNETEVPEFEMYMQRTTKFFYDLNK